MTEQKVCSTCGELKSVFDFHASNKRAGARTETNGYIQSRCKECQKADRRYYSKRNNEFLREIKTSFGCQDCGYNDHFSALDFHHIDPTTKKFSPTSGKGLGGSLKNLKIEIEKCIILCANCHRIHHYKEREDERTRNEVRLR